MGIAPSARVHPTAIVAPEAEVGEGVEVGPYAIIEGPVRVGPNCVIRARAHLIGPMTLGCDNDVGIGAILGERPQHLGYKGEVTHIEVGDGNIFREYVVVHRGTPQGRATVIGSHNFLMANCHIGHDVRLGDSCILANGALVAGHCVLEDRVFLSGNTGIHQFTRMGRLSLLSGLSSATRDAPPFVIVVRRDEVSGVNVIGMRRAGMEAEQIAAVRQAFHLLYRQSLMMSVAVQRMERELGHVPAVQELIQFIRTSKRGVLGGHHSLRDSESEAA